MKTFSTIATLSFFLALAAVATAQESGTTVGGYGELHYNEPEGSAGGRLDFHRFVIYLDHQFNDWISFASETELEHTFVAAEEDAPGELAIEQAYLELRPWERYGFRAGIMLAPVGIINLYHEPNTFHGVERPNYHRNVIPTTWREAGIGFFGAPAHTVNFQVYVVSSLKATGFSAGGGLRGGRQQGIESSTRNMAVTGRVEYMPLLGLSLGGSFFAGGADMGNAAFGDAAVTLFAGDVRYAVGNLRLRGEAAFISIADADMINAATESAIGDQINGWYAEAAYNFLPHIADSEQQLFVFGRYEMYNTQAETTGFEAMDIYDRNDVTVGLTWLPSPEVAVKMDYQLFDDARDLDARGQFNAGIGYAFF
ncbi:OprO/OprP family phosphate-selective porin [bacterium]|nr:OprO/OprP family phosphate-selective porin [bacterium]